MLAAGAWSSLFARRHGISIPQLAVRGTVAQTVPLPGFFAGTATDEHLALRRRDDGGYTLALADRHGFFPGPDAFRHFGKYIQLLRQSWKATDLKLKAPAGYPDAWRTKRNWDASETTPFETTRVLEPDPDLGDVSRMARLFEARFPELGRPEIRSSWAGMIDTMPDVVPIVDHVASLPGLIMATGMSGHGFGIGPGFGHVVARLAAGKDPGFDLHRFRFSRFSDGSPLKLGTAL